MEVTGKIYLPKVIRTYDNTDENDYAYWELETKSPN